MIIVGYMTKADRSRHVEEGVTLEAQAPAPFSNYESIKGAPLNIIQLSGV